MISKELVALGLVSAALAASGCGGSSKDVASGTQQGSSSSTATATNTASTGRPLTRVALIAAADPICRRFKTLRDTIRIKNTAEYARQAPRIAAYDRQELAELKKLTPPSSLSSTWQQMLTSVEMVTADTIAFGQNIQSNNTGVQANLIHALTQLEQEMSTAAKRSGFSYCGVV